MCAAFDDLPATVAIPDWMRGLGAEAQGKRLARYRTVDWARVPAPLRRATLIRLGTAGANVRTPVVIVGGGQSGLSVSRILQRDGINHIVLESRDVGESWRSRWDSFRLNTPNRTLSLPDYSYVGDDPDGFSSKEQVRGFLDDFARTFDLPILNHCPVTRVSREGDDYRVCSEMGTLYAEAVVVATGEYVLPKLPNSLHGPCNGLTVLHSSNYRRPDELPAGAVLVVGGGQSGAQIVEDIRDSGRKVFWSLSDRPSNIRRLFGKDFMEWWDIGGILHRHVQDIPDVKAGVPGALRRARSMEFPLVSGVGLCGLGHSISLVDLQRSGVTLLGKLERLDDGVARFSPHLNAQLARAQSGTRAEFALLRGFADDHFGQSDRPELEAAFIPAEVARDVHSMTSINELDLGRAGITTIVAATGYSSVWPWLDVPGLLDFDGYPLGVDGISPSEGIYFIGLFNLQRLSSTCLCNGGRDALTLTRAIRERLSRHDYGVVQAFCEAAGS